MAQTLEPRVRLRDTAASLSLILLNIVDGVGLAALDFWQFVGGSR